MSDNISTARRDEMLEKVRKLLAKAESVAGTPEADTFTQKALDLIAKYGIDETEALRTADSGPAPIVTIEIKLAGKFIPQQRVLLQRLAKALHCAPIWVSSQLDSETDREFVIGTELHTDRVRVLFSMLLPQLLAGAKRTRPPEHVRTSTVSWRRSWIIGFVRAVSERLEASETTAANDAPGTGLVLVDDARRAEDELRNFTNGRPTQRAKVRHRHNDEAGRQGHAAGSKVGLGGTSVAGRLAIGR